MAYITDPEQAREIYERHARAGVPVARIGSSSYVNNEALIRACSEFAREQGLRRMPVSLFFTANYPNMRQMARVTTTGRPELGFLVSAAMVRELVGCRYSPFTNVDVIPHLDHGQPGDDDVFLHELRHQFATVMFDASQLPFEENIARTRDYVKAVAGRTLVEGAVEEVSVEGVWDTKDRLTTPAQARRFLGETGCDLIVPNIGTESQKETSEKLRYERGRVREIYAALEKKVMVIHGVSSLSLEELSTLSEDGVAGVNIWTRFARAAGEEARRVIAAADVPKSEKDPNRRFDPFDVTYHRAWIEKFVAEVKEFLCQLGSVKLANSAASAGARPASST
ncbi:MAG: class II fructose-bisphosphate aldolase [Planctomycetes bacterium]|nr:class II fructose-bisphosphate aldolase [Planctomycetota bacterium]